MPAGAVAALLAPFGLAAPALWVMEQGAAWILYVARVVADMDGSVTGIVEPGPWVLPLVTLGGAWLVIWQERLRLWGGLPLMLALLLWTQAARPVAIIDAEGGVVGLLGPDGRVLSAPKGASFAVKSWLENDGDLVGQDIAAARAGFDGPRAARVFRLGEWRGIMLSGRGAAAQLASACAAHDLVVLRADAIDVPEGCNVVDAALLASTGPLGVWVTGDALRLHPTQVAQRRWSPQAVSPVVIMRRPDRAIAGAAPDQ